LQIYNFVQKYKHQIYKLLRSTIIIYINTALYYTLVYVIYNAANKIKAPTKEAANPSLLALDGLSIWSATFPATETVVGSYEMPLPAKTCFTSSELTASLTTPMLCARDMEVSWKVIFTKRTKVGRVAALFFEKTTVASTLFSGTPTFMAICDSRLWMVAWSSF